GGYFNESDFTHEEAQATRDLFLDGALSATADAGVGLLAGSALGGGTLINYTTSFATPDRIREEWDDVAGFDEVFTGDDYTAASQAVHARLGINRDHNALPGREMLLEKGLSNLGWHVDRMPRNVVGCPENGCGFCTMGCRRGARKCTTTTYLQDAYDAGARIVVNADARRVITSNGQATGVECVVAGQPLTVRARAVVVAAGALNTPAVLLRSGLGGPAVGHFLRLHPVDPWSGTMQAIYSDEFEDVDGKGHGFKFETAPVHPLFPSVFLGWSSAAQYQHDVLELQSLQPVGILLRDRNPGRVTVRKNGTPVWHYRVSKADQANMRVGLQRASQLLAASGAREIMSSSQPPVRLSATTDTPSLMATLDRVGYGPNETVYVSFHQMGSARMGSNPRMSVVGPSNELHDTKGVYVMDGSCFPTASGVNPMTTIQTIAHRGAQMLANSLTA
ncbi:MAG: GMC family oxidoreductase N-terminal domain-containing protein, partial [Acidimicrobiia bacterium]|nr:GMC family oxidoreductase N-terminal domain-containing protein [Acidimicrobiia bacterium]